MDSVDQILEERDGTHGSFRDNARIGMGLRRAIRSAMSCRDLNNAAGRCMSDVELEALHHICGKISRILSGPKFEADHWRDIAGYAILAGSLGDSDGQE